jgi:hypothetical protein
MASPGLGFGTPLASDPQAVFRERIALAQAKIKRGANWFNLIAALSVINAAIAMANGNWRFVLGLGITDVLNAYAHAGRISPLAGIMVTVPVAAFFWLMGRFAKQGQRWALIVGMVLYALDGAILVNYQLWLSAAFHGYALFMLSRTIPAIKELETAQHQAEASGVFPNQPIG